MQTMCNNVNSLCDLRLLGVNLLDLVDALVQCAINSSRNSERATNHCAQAHKEARESLVTDFAVDDLHGGYVLDRG
jgi:hypothetical protein